MNLFVNAEAVMGLVEALEFSKYTNKYHEHGFDDDTLAKFEALASAMIVTLVPPTVPEPVAKRTGVPLGDETMPTEARLMARLEAACRLIDSFNVYSIFSIRFVAEQQRFLQELRSNAREAATKG